MSTLPKKIVAELILSTSNYPSLFVHFDPRHVEAVIPPWLRHQASMVFQVGYAMPIPIVDLRIDDNGVFGTLSFARTPFTCFVPWAAVYALVGDNDRGQVWDESMPAEVKSELVGKKLATKRQEIKIPIVTTGVDAEGFRATRASHLRIADGGKIGTQPKRRASKRDDKGGPRGAA